jgi:hypothetical protein
MSVTSEVPELAAPLCAPRKSAALGQFRTSTAVQQRSRYWITSSASASSPGGTVMPEVLAVSRSGTIPTTFKSCPAASSREARDTPTRPTSRDFVPWRFSEPAAVPSLVSAFGMSESKLCAARHWVRRRHHRATAVGALGRELLQARLTQAAQQPSRSIF